MSWQRQRFLRVGRCGPLSGRFIGRAHNVRFPGRRARRHGSGKQRLREGKEEGGMHGGGEGGVQRGHVQRRYYVLPSLGRGESPYSSLTVTRRVQEGRHCVLNDIPSSKARHCCGVMYVKMGFSKRFVCEEQRRPKKVTEAAGALMSSARGCCCRRARTLATTSVTRATVHS